MFQWGMRKAFGLMLMVIMAVAMGVAAHADGPAPEVGGGIVKPQCHMQWEGNFCP